MREASTSFLQEEARLRDAKPRLKAVIYPFDVDFGLGPGLGVFEHTFFGGEPGRLVLEAGYLEYAAWTSPVRQTFSPHLSEVTPYWEDHVNYMRTRLYLRSADHEGEVGAAPYTTLKSGEAVKIRRFFQLKVEFTDSTWSGEPPGYISGLRLEGRLTIPESAIIDPGEVHVSLARDFGELRAGNHTLVLDNRQGQWLPRFANFAFLGLPWEEKRLDLFHGWELPDGTTEWLLVYRGVVETLAGMAHGWRERHRVRLETRDWIAHRLRKRIGTPTAAGERRPFMRGVYRSRAELVRTSPAQVFPAVKTGSGSAVLKVLPGNGTPPGGKRTGAIFWKWKLPERWGRPLSGGPPTRGRAGGKPAFSRRERKIRWNWKRAWRYTGNPASARTSRPGTASVSWPGPRFTTIRFSGPPSHKSAPFT